MECKTGFKWTSTSCEEAESIDFSLAAGTLFVPLLLLPVPVLEEDKLVIDAVPAGRPEASTEEDKSVPNCDGLMVTWVEPEFSGAGADPADD